MITEVKKVHVVAAKILNSIQNNDLKKISKIMLGMMKRNILNSK